MSLKRECLEREQERIIERELDEILRDIEREKDEEEWDADEWDEEEDGEWEEERSKEREDGWED
jgi:hypothetical protein